MELYTKDDLVRSDIVGNELQNHKEISPIKTSGNYGDKDAKASHEANIVFYSVYNFFNERNMLDRGCEQFKEMYQKLYPMP